MDESILNTEIDHYRIIDRIKAGGVAVVYQALDLNTDKIVAFKLLQAGWLDHEEVVIRFEREAKIMHQLRHPHIVQFYGYGTYKNRPYIAMEYLPGGSLSERLKKYTQISLGGTARLIEQMASALDYAHGKGIVHRDLKPGNILLRDQMHAALTDFGIARLMEHTMLTTVGYMPGTPHYMSPEQAQGAEELDHLSDLYSLGVIAFLLVTGKLPFSGFDPLVVINQHLTSPPPRATQRNPDLPPALDQVLVKALAKKPSDRFDSAGELSYALSEAVASSSKLVVTLTERPAAAEQKAATGEIPISNTNTPIMDDMDPVSQVFSSRGFAQPADMTKNRLDMPPLNQMRKPQGRGGCLWGLALALVPTIAVVFGLLLAFGVIDFNGSDDPIPTQAVVAVTTEDSTAEATNPEVTDAIEQTATQDAIVEQRVAQTSQAEATNISGTATAASTPTATETATATSTATETAIPSQTPTPTPLFYTMDDFIIELQDGMGTSGRFDCQEFIKAYNFLEEQLTTSNSPFEDARVLIEAPDSPFQSIYDEHCALTPNDTEAFITGELYADFRTTLNTLR